MPDAIESDDEVTAPISVCLHRLTVPLEVGSDEGKWIHWCSTCGAVSSESNDVEQPKEPWFLPGELSEDDVMRINRAARGE